MVDLDKGTDERMDEFLDFLVGKMRHAQWWGRKEVLGGYCQGLMMEGDRKSMEAMAARLDPLHTRAQHQALQHMITDSEWDHHALVQAARDYALPGLLSHGPVEAWTLDDVSYIKQGKHSVGVARQYCGALGKTANCQVAVSVSLTNSVGSLPAAFRLYLPKAWVDSPELSEEVGIPAGLQFLKKWANLCIATYAFTGRIGIALDREPPPLGIAGTAGVGGKDRPQGAQRTRTFLTNHPNGGSGQKSGTRAIQ